MGTMTAQLAGPVSPPAGRTKMPEFAVNTHRFDPYKNFKFRVKWTVATSRA
jgi:hypothetical protein